jgi:MoxR-like ATPase
MKPALVPSSPSSPSSLDGARQRLVAVGDNANASNPESKLIVRAVLACLVARSNALLLGPPGVGKSRIARHVCHALGGNFFEILMNRYTTPDEVFGPFSMKGIEADAFRRVTTGRLPAADVVFLDEVFKANSAVLNTLLGVMNEHVFHDEGQAKSIPTQLIIAASNELPAGDELAAMHDRFLVRLYKRDVEDDSNMRAILARTLPAMSARATLDDVRELRAAADALPIADSALDAVLSIRAKAKKAGIIVSARRWDQSMALLRADAVLNGASAVTTANLTLLPSCMWTTHDQHAKCTEIVGEFSASWVRDVQAIGAALDEQNGAVNNAKQDKRMSRASKASALGAVVDQLDVIKGKLEALTKDAPDAAPDVTRLDAREKEIRKAAVDAFRGAL